MGLTLSQRTRVITAVDTPLAFFVLALLIVESFLATVLIGVELDPSQKIIGMFIGVGLFLFVTLAVFLLVWSKPENLTFDKEAHLNKSKVYGSENNVIENPNNLPTDRGTPQDDPTKRETE